ncbi:inner membrane protein YpjD, partial [Pseudomonas syringae pv. tagetis]
PSLLHSLAAANLYAAATVYKSLPLSQAVKPDKRLHCLLGTLAVVAHAIGLSSHLPPSAGLGLDVFNSASLIAASVIVVT